MNKKYTQTQIIDYVEGKLPKELLADFETEIENDIDLKKEVNQYKNTILLLKLQQDNILKTKMKQWDSELENEKKGKIIPFYMKFSVSIAASIVFAFLSFHFLILPRNNSVIYNQFYSEYEYMSSRSIITEPTCEETCMELFQLKKYDDYLTNIKNCSPNLINSESEESIKLRFYKAISLMETKDYKKSALEFESLQSLSINEISLKNDIDWYYILCLAKLGETEKAIFAISKLSSESKYFEKSQILKTTLQKYWYENLL